MASSPDPHNHIVWSLFHDALYFIILFNIESNESVTPLPCLTHTSTSSLVICIFTLRVIISDSYNWFLGSGEVYIAAIPSRQTVYSFALLLLSPAALTNSVGPV